MKNFRGVGESVPRKEAYGKVTGAAKYTNDFIRPGMLHAKMVTSPYAHARIKSIDTSAAWENPEIRAVITGRFCPVLTGEEIRDRPPIAVEKVRYYGEVVAVVVADTEYEAKRGAESVRVEYDPLPVVNSPSEAVQSDAPLLHANLADYERTAEVYPEPGTNIAHRTRIRKGNMEKGWSESEVVVESFFFVSPVRSCGDGNALCDCRNFARRTNTNRFFHTRAVYGETIIEYLLQY
ncbi:hypothetical protein skT53_13100 [Effusibacillus dendaii]|uniref:Aldehyde oxidase/xanthine dehydrogenase a/b hammerhead domain-containing protein n=1 Tax=Effusibacillus dendaii TaxID=2743772 RepID=A0A7I8D8B7_9BACL|nr:hypothetical protein skT53_13100 [Effusibacillus dendaii]